MLDSNTTLKDEGVEGAIELKKAALQMRCLKELQFSGNKLPKEVPDLCHIPIAELDNMNPNKSNK